jgi:hypothetical protein
MPILRSLIFILISIQFLKGIPAICQFEGDEELDYQFALLGTEKGAYWVYSCENNSFYYNITSDSIFSTGVDSYFLINDKIFQSTVVKTEEGMPEKMPGKEETEEILLDYMTHELMYLKNKQKLDIPGVEYKFVEIGRFYFMEWWYNINNSENDIRSRTNLSVLCFEAILNLNVSVREGQNIKMEKDFLREAGKTLVKVLGPMDFHKMAEDLQKE